MSSLQLNANFWAMGNYGPGGPAARPQLNRWVVFQGIANAAMFIPQNSAAERLSVYNSNAFQTRRTGQYTLDVGSGNNRYQLYQNNAAIGNGPCWIGLTGGNNSNYNTPPGCGAGLTDGGVDNEKPINPNDYANQATIQHNAAGWTFYQNKGYGCATGNSTGISNRWCFYAGYSSNNTSYQVF